MVQDTYFIIIPSIGYDIITQSSQKDTLILCRRKNKLITKHEEKNFQPRLWPSSVVVN